MFNSDVSLTRLSSCRKKLDPAEEEIKMNEERIHKLMKILRNISKDLKAQLQRKSLLLGTKHYQPLKPIDQVNAKYIL